MTSQPPLLSPSGSDLPGPMFASRPGWGGRLKAWLQENLYIMVFRAVVFGVVAFVLWTFIRTWQADPAITAQSPTPTSSSQNWSLRTAAARGQGMTHLAAWAVNAYSSQHVPAIKLTAVEHLFAVDTLARKAGWQRLEPGQETVFSADDIEVIIVQAKALSSAQRAAWSRYLHK